MYSFAALAVGALLYGVYRQDTYVGQYLGRVLQLRLYPNGVLSAVAAWYLPDYLWMFSMNCALFAVILPQGRKTLIWCGLALFCGVLWEVLQWCAVIPGTGDWWDILMYSLAVFMAAIINLSSKKENEV